MSKRKSDREENPGAAPPGRWRLDVFLKWAGLVRRRTMAKWMCDRQTIQVNGQAAKAGKLVSVGDRIHFHRPPRSLVVEILALPERSSKQHPPAGAPSPTACYRILVERTAVSSQDAHSPLEDDETTRS